MARVAFLTRVIDEAGNALGGSPTEVRIWDDFGATAATVVSADTAGAITITQPIIPNAGTQTTLTVTTAAVDTTITVASTTGFSVGQIIPIYDGTTTKYRWITAILAGPPRLTLESAIGVIFSNTNTSVGNPDMQGVVAGYVSDTTFHYIQTKDVASTRVMPPTLIPTMIGVSSVGVGEEGATVGTRSLINFIGAGATAVDNPGATRVDVTVPGYGHLGPTMSEFRLEPYGQTTALGTVTLVGSGALTVPSQAGRGIKMTTGATNPSSVALRSPIFTAGIPAGTPNTNRARRVEFGAMVPKIANLNCYLYFTDETTTTAPSATTRHIGIKSLVGVFRFTTADGTTEQTTDVSAFVATNANTRYIILFDGTTATLYIDGVLRATHATNVPTASGVSPSFYAFIDNNSTTTNSSMNLDFASIVVLVG